jgi:hypothetical protein
MAASEWDCPEHFKAGLKPHGPKEKYYYARGPQLVNRVVDIGPYIDQNVWVNMANVTQGPAGNQGARLRRALANNGRSWHCWATMMRRPTARIPSISR